MELGQIGIMLQIIGILIGILGAAILAPDVFGKDLAGKVEREFLSLARKIAKVVPEEPFALPMQAVHLMKVAVTGLSYLTSVEAGKVGEYDLKKRIWALCRAFLFPLLLVLLLIVGVLELGRQALESATTLMATKGVPRAATILGGALLVIVGLFLELVASR